MIICEGPDGSGKSRLVSDLSKELGLPVAKRSSKSKKGPVDDLTGWVEKDMAAWSDTPVSIYDRYPLISEPIYGLHIRGSVGLDFGNGWMTERWQQLVNQSFVVFCLPAYETVVSHVSKSRDMKGVVENIDRIYLSYQVLAETYLGRCFIHDFENPYSFQNLLDEINYSTQPKGKRHRG